MAEILPARPAIDRALLEHDLARMVDLLTPLIELRLEFLRNLTWRVLGREVPVGAMLLGRLQGSPRSMTSAAFARLLELTDDELVALVDGIGVELGAWRGFNAPLDDAGVAALEPAWDGLVGVLDR